MGEIKSMSEIIEEVSPYYKKKKAPEASHTLVYDSSSETLEPVYFFILDLMNNLGLAPEKIEDNFSSTPGSGHFAELGQRATVMQQQAGKIMGDVNTVLRSVLNIVYDLKEFKIRLSSYDGLKSKNKYEQEAAMLSLKQIWMDKVDINKGNSSIKAMTFGQSGFQTLVDAFLVVKDESLKGIEGKEIDLNDRVKRIVKSRIIEFNIWLKESEKELKKRYELEKTYLKSQVNSLKLYSRWVRPYLKAAQDLESKESTNPALVKTFNTIILELTLLGKNKLDVPDEAAKGNIPADFAKEKFMGKRRNYHSCILVSFTFRGIPQRISQQSHYAFGGRAEINFKAYSLNDDELKKFNEELKKSEVNDVLNLIEGATTESLTHLEEDINSFLNEKTEEKKESKEWEANPFLALFGVSSKKEKKKMENPLMSFLDIFGFGKKPETKKETSKETTVSKDDYVEESFFRPLAAQAAKDKAYDLFDIYKKSHGMESFT
jgi:hypothetical protein